MSMRMHRTVPVVALAVALLASPASARDVPATARAVPPSGVIGIEVTMTTPKAISGIEKLADTMGDRCVVGVGTILEPATCADAIHAGR